ncbi:hypothetical protein [Paludisphaera soli]|uniref:hypothetical protein n=1 Tax=Paludisphaera soli TaxID=2712865 RepID=UPI0013EAF50D|nr:hypothetical protein [Paludisphaera soli]
MMTPKSGDISNMPESNKKSIYIESDLLERVALLGKVQSKWGIDIEAKAKNLTPLGINILGHSIACYLSYQPINGEILLLKSIEYLELAHASSEKQKHQYTPGYCEFLRTAHLSLARWLSTGMISQDLLRESQGHLTDYVELFMPSWKPFSFDLPAALFTKSYDAIAKVYSDGSKPRDRFPGIPYKHMAQAAETVAKLDSQSRFALEDIFKNYIKGFDLLQIIHSTNYTAIGFIFRLLGLCNTNPPSLSVSNCWNIITDPDFDKILPPSRS